MSTFSVEDRTRMYTTGQDGDSLINPRVRVRLEGRYLGPLDDEQFERALPPEVLTELLKETPPLGREAPRSLQPAPPPVVTRPPLPVSPPPPPVSRQAPSTAGAPPKEQRARELLLGLSSLLILIAFLVPIATVLHQLGGGSQFPHALPQPWVEVRRALPAVPRAVLVSAPTSGITDPYVGQWYPVRFADGTVMRVRYGGRLSSPAFLPGAGEFIGDARVIDNHYWIWMQPTGAPASWVDP